MRWWAKTLVLINSLLLNILCVWILFQNATPTNIYYNCGSLRGMSSPDNKLHKIFPVLKECIICPRTNRKETVMAWLHIPLLHIPFYWSVRNHNEAMYIGCDEVLTIEHILPTCSDLIEIRESHSLCVISGYSTWEDI